MIRLTRGVKRRLAALACGAAVLGTVIGIAMVAIGVPAWLASILASTLFAVVITCLPEFVLRARDRELSLLLDISLSDTEVRWINAFPDEPMPRTPDEIADWLSRRDPHESDPDALTLETSGFLRLGRYEEARAHLTRLPMEPMIRNFIHEYLRAKLEFNTKELGSLNDATRVANELEAEDRIVAVAELALAEGGRAVVLGVDWGPPIAAAYRDIGGAAPEYYLRKGLRRARRYGLRVALGMFIVAAAVTWLPQSLT